MRACFIIVACFVLVTSPAAARTVDPGAFSLGGGVGPGLRLGSLLDAGRFYLVLAGQAEYTLTSTVSTVGDVSFGFGSAFPLRLHIGGRYRFSDFGLPPISPYVQVQLSLGRILGVLGASLTYVGMRAGGGVDYFLTRNFAVGAVLGADGGFTTGERPALYNVFDLLVYATYTF